MTKLNIGTKVKITGLFGKHYQPEGIIKHIDGAYIEVLIDIGTPNEHLVDCYPEELTILDDGV